MIRIEFSNSHDRPILVQVDPWASLYELKPGERIELLAPSSAEQPAFTIDECDRGYRILTLWNCDEFFVVRDGQRIHWADDDLNLAAQAPISESSVSHGR